MKLPAKGCTVLTDTISGWELAWSQEVDNEVWPDMYDTEREAQLEILDVVEHEIQQFKDDEREYDEINWTDTYYVCEIEIDEFGGIVVWHTDGEGLIKTTIEQWRANR